MLFVFIIISLYTLPRFYHQVITFKSSFHHLLVVSSTKLSFYIIFIIDDKITRQQFGARRRAYSSPYQQPHQQSSLLITTTIPRRTCLQNLAQNQSFESQNQTQASYPPQRLGKEKVTEQTDVDLAQVVSR